MQGVWRLAKPELPLLLDACSSKTNGYPIPEKLLKTDSWLQPRSTDSELHVDLDIPNLTPVH